MSSLFRTPACPLRPKGFPLFQREDYNKAMELVVARFRTFEEAEAATREYYRRLFPEERLERLFQLRAMAHEEDGAASQPMVSVCRIAQLKRG
jgi:hypothetical protein